MLFTGLKTETNADLTLDLADAAFFGPTSGDSNARAIINQIAARMGYNVTIS